MVTWRFEDQPLEMQVPGECRRSYINHIVANHDGVFYSCPECGKEFERKEKTKVHTPSSGIYKTLDSYYQERLAQHLLTKHNVIDKGWKPTVSRDTYLCPHKVDSGQECGYSHTCATKFEHHLR